MVLIVMKIHHTMHQCFMVIYVNLKVNFNGLITSRSPYDQLNSLLVFCLITRTDQSDTMPLI